MKSMNNVDPESNFKKFVSAVWQFGTVQFSHSYMNVSAAISGDNN